MSDTAPAPPPPAAPQDQWSNRFTLIVGAAGYLTILGAVVLYLFQTQDVQIGLLIIGALIGILSQGQSWYNRGRVENPTQTRTGTGDGGSGGAPVNGADQSPPAGRTGRVNATGRTRMEPPLMVDEDPNARPPKPPPTGP